jgi:hypothetical protein
LKARIEADFLGAIWRLQGSMMFLNKLALIWTGDDKPT